MSRGAAAFLFPPPRVHRAGEVVRSTGGGDCFAGPPPLRGGV